MKRCNYCNIEKMKQLFSVKKGSKDGLNFECRECNTKRIAEYRSKRKCPFDKTEVMVIGDLRKNAHKLIKLHPRPILIWNREWKRRNKQVMNLLNSKFNKNKTVGARKCRFIKIDWNTSKDFCEVNHIQGKPNHSLYSIGAYFNEELVGVVVFSRHPRDSKRVCLSRLCFKDGLNIIGALSKFSKMGSEYFKCEITTWVHLELSDGISYVNSGWTITGIVKPQPFYINNGEYFSEKSIKNKLNETSLKTYIDINGYKENKDCGKITLIYPYKRQK